MSGRKTRGEMKGQRKGRKGHKGRNHYVQQQGPSQKKTQDCANRSPDLILTNVGVRFVPTSEEKAKFKAFFDEQKLDGKRHGGCI